MSQIQHQNQLHRFFVPFDLERVDKEQRIVRGYCYTSGRVKGDKWNLTPTALKNAAVSYMEMPCVRAMHGNVAAGKGLSVEFDEQNRGILEAKIVDDNEWNKVLEGVYRGFSIGGRPELVRGNNIDKFDWVETSLVDRPCDPGALFTVVRADGAADAPYEVLVAEEGEDLSAEELQRWDENKHPRHSDGKFRSGGGGSEAGEKKDGPKKDEPKSDEPANGEPKKDEAQGEKDKDKGAEKDSKKDSKTDTQSEKSEKPSKEDVDKTSDKDGHSDKEKEALKQAHEKGHIKTKDELAAASKHIKGKGDEASPGLIDTFMQGYRNGYGKAGKVLDAAHLTRVLTSSDVPVRENLEGEIQTLRQNLDETDDKDARALIEEAIENAEKLLKGEGLNRAEGSTGPLREAYAWFSGQMEETKAATFKDRVGASLNDILAEAFRTALWRFLDTLMEAPTLEARHQNVTDFAQFLNVWLDHDASMRTELARGEGLQGEATDEPPFTALLALITDSLCDPSLQRREGENSTPQYISRAEVATQYVARAQFDELEVQRADAVQRADRLESDLTLSRADVELLRGQLSDEQEKVSRLEKLPLERNTPVRFPTQAAERDFAANKDLEGAVNKAPVTVAEKRADLMRQQTELLQRAQSSIDPNEREQAAVGLSRISIALANLG